MWAISNMKEVFNCFAMSYLLFSYFQKFKHTQTLFTALLCLHSFYSTLFLSFYFLSVQHHTPQEIQNNKITCFILVYFVSGWLVISQMKSIPELVDGSLSGMEKKTHASVCNFYRLLYGLQLSCFSWVKQNCSQTSTAVTWRSKYVPTWDFVVPQYVCSGEARRNQSMMAQKKL